MGLVATAALAAGAGLCWLILPFTSIFWMEGARGQSAGVSEVSASSVMCSAYSVAVSVAARRCLLLAW